MGQKTSGKLWTELPEKRERKKALKIKGKPDRDKEIITVKALGKKTGNANKWSGRSS